MTSRIQSGLRSSNAQDLYTGLLGSNLGRATGYTDEVPAAFFGFSRRIMGDYLPSNSLFIYHPTVRRYILQTLTFSYQSTAPQPIVRPWPLLQFRNHFYTDGASARRKAATYTQDSTNTE
jgi:hypothetical protein